MATYVPAKKNTAFVTYVSLLSQANGQIFQANPTFAAGDVKVAIDDGAPANLATLPAVDADFTKRVKVSLSAAEMNGDNISLIFSDVAGAEWADLTVTLQTAVRQIDDLAFPNTSGRGMDVDASGGVEVGSFQAGAITAAAIATDAITAAKMADGAIDAATFAAGAIDATAIASAAITSAKFAAGAITATVIATDAIDADAIAADAVTELQAGLSTLTAAGIRTAVGLASANLDTQLTTIDDFLDLEVAAIKAKTDQLTFTSSNKVDATLQAAADLAQAAADKAWSTAARTLTAGTNIVLAKGTGVTGFTDLSAAQVNAEADTALADVGVTTTITGRIDAAVSSRASQTLVDTIAGYLDTEVAAIKAKTDTLPASPAAVGSAMTLTSGERDSVGSALLDLSAGVETGLTPRQALRLMVSALAGKLSGAATTTIVIRNAVADSKDRITATVDSSGNRTAITTDLT